MNRQSPMEILDNSIHRLEREQVLARQAFYGNLREMNERINPAAIIRNFIEPKHKEVEPVTHTGNMLGLAAGFLLKKLLPGAVRNPLLKFAVPALQRGVSRYVSKHQEPIITAGTKLFQKIFSKKRNNQTPENNEREN